MGRISSLLAGVVFVASTSGCSNPGWFRPAGYLHVSTAPAHDGAWLPALAACRELGVPEAIQPLSAAEVGARCHSPASAGRWSSHRLSHSKYRSARTARNRPPATASSGSSGKSGTSVDIVVACQGRSRPCPPAATSRCRTRHRRASPMPPARNCSVRSTPKRNPVASPPGRETRAPTRR